MPGNGVVPRAPARQALLLGALVLHAACARTAAYSLGAGDQSAVRRWLLCEECWHGELDSLRVPPRGDRVVPLLASALDGPPPRGRANVRRQLEATYQRLVDHAAARGEAPSRTREQYIGHFLGNYEAQYQTRAIAGLVAIGTPDARRVLAEAMDRVRTGRAVYRGDVLEELSRAVGAAASAAKLGWTTIAAGSIYTCAIRTDSAAYCWGGNFSGELGDSSEIAKRRPTRVAAPTGFTAIATTRGGAHTCGIVWGRVYCWGRNTSGQLGDSTTTGRLAPGLVRSGIAYVGLTLGDAHTCAWTGAGEAFCWGSNQKGQLGDGTTESRSWPVPAADSLRFVNISAGGAHTCGSLPSGQAYCWGDNEAGQLGDGSRTGRPAPAALTQPLHLEALAAGSAHTCGLTRGAPAVRDAQAYCAGSNQDGQLGDTLHVAGDSLRRVVGGRGFIMLSVGTRHTCGITRGREAFCWGNNDFGQLGDGTRDSRPAPVRVNGGLRFVVVSAGAAHTCGVTVRGEAYCWGRNDRGQLGDGTDALRLVPTRVESP